jgi:hypothetical protein
MKAIKINYSIKLVAILALALLVISGRSVEESKPVPAAISPADADALLINAKAWTGNPSQPWVETIAIKGSRMIAAVTKSLEAEFKANETIDAGGKLVLPGFIDNHAHFMDGAATLLSIDAQSAKTKDAFINVIKDHEAWGGELPHKDGLTNILKTIRYFYSVRTATWA